jgi:hypothetical protein
LHSFVADRRAGVAVVLATAALVVLRSYIFVRYGPAFFDSDQAIVGLMAKHLSEGRGFPLFYYGQNYMLGVESWVAVPFFWLGGPTVAMLRVPLVLVNVAVALAAVILFVRRGLAPWFAFVAALPVIATTPICSAEFLKARVSIEPFLYVLILWGLRRRAAVFGAVFCLACLHREFSAFALPAIVVALWLEGRSWSLKEWLRAMVGFAVVWGAIDVLKWHVNTLGPAGGVQETSSLGQEARILGEWLSFEWAGYAARLQSVVSALPDLLGARPYALGRWGLDDSLSAGSTAAGVAMATAAVIAVVRLAMAIGTSRRRATDSVGPGARLALPAYLGIIALENLAVYGLNGGIDPRAMIVTRYVLLTLLAPVALFGGWLIMESHRGWRAAIVALIALSSAMTVADNARWLLKLRASRPAGEFQLLAADLVAHGVRYGRAQYWDAYVVTFLARERVILASTGKVCISAYQTVVDAHAAEVATITRLPCEGGRRVASWCVVWPGPGE